MQNLTVGSPTRLILTFALPLLIGNIFQQLYVFTDSAITGRLLGLNALAAVGACGGLIFLLVGFSFGSGAGLAIPVARAFGAGDHAGVRRLVAAGTYISVIIAAIITTTGVVFAEDLLRLLGTPEQIIAGSTTFLTITCAGASATVAFNFLASIIRALGDSRTPLYFLIGSSVLNAVLVAVFIGGIGWGVGGAAAATVLATASTVAACLVLIKRRMPALHLTRADWAAGRFELAEPLRTGLPMGLQASVIAVGSILLQASVNQLGATAVAAYTTVLRVEQLAVTPLGSFGTAIATFVAQNRGARQWQRIRAGTWRICLVSSAAAVGIGAFLMAFAPIIMRAVIGSGHPQVLAMGRTYFLLSTGAYIFLALLFVLRNAVQGMGRGTAPTLAGILELVARGVAGLVLVQHFGWVGVALAGPLAWFGAFVPVAIAWLRQRRVLVEREDDDRRRAADASAADRADEAALVTAS